jgi:CRISPR-associated protein Cmr3
VSWKDEMNTRNLAVHALSPLLFRDARPFTASGDESRARSLMLPNPGTLAGFVRTVAGDALGWNWHDPQVLTDALTLTLNGFLLRRDTQSAAGENQSEFVLPAPMNALIYREVDPETGDALKGPKHLKVLNLRPMDALPDGAGCDLPAPAEAAASHLRPLAITQDVKAETGYSLWRWADLEGWLCGEAVMPTKIAPPATDERVHVALDTERQTAEEGMLFTVEYRALEGGDNRIREPKDGEDKSTPYAHWTLHLRGQFPALPQHLRTHLGGERRPVTATVLEDREQDWLRPSKKIRDEFVKSKRVCFMLVTPAIFGEGWKPKWLTELEAGHAIEHGPAGMPQLAGAKVVGAAVGRAEAVSGWNYDVRKRGPKATRRMAPAGSVYFLELPEALTEDAFDELWLKPLSDAELDRNDGYGMAVWGVWQ